MDQPFLLHNRKAPLLAIILSFLIGCVNKNPGSTQAEDALSSPQNLTVGGEVAGLNSTRPGIDPGKIDQKLILGNRNGEQLTVIRNGIFTFHTPLLDGESYEITVLQSPSAQTCTVTEGVGEAHGKNITNIAVKCLNNRIFVLVNVSGLSKKLGDITRSSTGLTLSNDLTKELANIESDGRYLFVTPIDRGIPSAIRVDSPPKRPASTCIVHNESAVETDTDVIVDVACEFNRYLVGGTIFDLHTDNKVTLELEDQSYGEPKQSKEFMNGKFAFNEGMIEGQKYTIRVSSPPSNQVCIPGSFEGIVPTPVVSNGTPSSSGSSTPVVSYVGIHCGKYWTWMGGSNTANVEGVSIGTPENPATPGSRFGSAFWRGKDGVVWVFGGKGGVATGKLHFNDLWKLEGTTWTLVSANSAPHARAYPAHWVDRDGTFWMFGGYSYDANGKLGTLNDLWKFDGKTWTLLSGSESIDAVTVLTTANGLVATPGARAEAVGWSDKDNNHWIFGGYNYGYRNEVWKFDGANWSWQGGDNDGGYYGTPRKNIPSARSGHVGWVDVQGNFWMYGGYGYIDPKNPPGSSQTTFFQDFWKFDGQVWTLLGGGVSNSPSMWTPTSRADAASWVDKDGNFWLFGGYAGPYFPGARNDLYRFDGVEWKSYFSGNSSSDYDGVYGEIGVPSMSNKPGSREKSAGWSDAEGNLWIFGGGNYSNYRQNTFNDLWIFRP